ASAAASPRRPSRSPTRLPRRAATLRGELLVISAENAALIMLCGFEVPIDLATTSCTPSASKMARIGPPAMMPVPGLAARNTTRPAPKWPFTSWCRVRPSRSGTRTMPRLACSVALRIASGTSRALPAPWPTRPLPSPTTTRAAKPNRRPPFTTLATRLMLTSFSTSSTSSRGRSLSRSRSRSRRSFGPLAIVRPLELQAALAGGIGQGLDPTMEDIGAAVEHHGLHAGRGRPLRDQLADRLGGLDVGARLERALQALVDRRCRRQGGALGVVDHLGIDVLAGAEY